MPDTELAEELLQIEEADAWFEYLESTRGQGHGRYQELEPWARAARACAPQRRDGEAGASTTRVADSLASGTWPLISPPDAARGAPLLRFCARAR